MCGTQPSSVKEEREKGIILATTKSTNKNIQN